MGVQSSRANPRAKARRQVALAVASLICLAFGTATAFGLAISVQSGVAERALGLSRREFWLMLPVHNMGAPLRPVAGSTGQYEAIRQSARWEQTGFEIMTRDFSSVGLARPDLTDLYPDPVPIHVPAWVRLPKEPGVGCAFSRGYGWPFITLHESWSSPARESFELRDVFHARFDVLSRTAPRGWSSTALSVYVPGAVASSFAWATVYWTPIAALLGVRVLRRRRRSRRGQCRYCGYSLAGIEPGQCPECGEHLSSRA